MRYHPNDSHKSAAKRTFVREPLLLLEKSSARRNIQTDLFRGRIRQQAAVMGHPKTEGSRPRRMLTFLSQLWLTTESFRMSVWHFVVDPLVEELMKYPWGKDSLWLMAFVVLASSLVLVGYVITTVSPHILVFIAFFSTVLLKILLSSRTAFRNVLAPIDDLVMIASLRLLSTKMDQLPESNNFSIDPQVLPTLLLAVAIAVIKSLIFNHQETVIHLKQLTQSARSSVFTQEFMDSLRSSCLEIVNRMLQLVVPPALAKS